MFTKQTNILEKVGKKNLAFAFPDSRNKRKSEQNQNKVNHKFPTANLVKSDTADPTEELYTENIGTAN